jgi:hypothetical protein
MGLYYDYLTNYHTSIYLDTIVSSSEFVINTLTSYTSTVNAAVGNTVYI